MVEQFNPQAEADKIYDVGTAGFHPDHAAAEKLRNEVCNLGPAQREETMKSFLSNYADVGVEREKDGTPARIIFYYDDYLSSAIDLHCKGRPGE